MIGNKIADSITKVSKTIPQNNSKTVAIEHDKEIPKERYISPEKRQKIIDDLRLIWKYNNGISKMINLLDNTPNQPSKHRTRNWGEINDDPRRKYNKNS